MNKTELVAMMAQKSNMTKKDTESALNALVESITETMKKGDKISLVGFGTFETRQRAERNGINPQTKKAIKIPATKAPAFKAGKALKDAVNN